MKERITTNDVLQGLYYLASGFAVKKIEPVDTNGEISFEFEITEAGISKIKQIYNKHKGTIDIFIFKEVLKTLTALFELEIELLQGGSQ